MAGSEFASITNEGTNTGQMVGQQNFFGKVAKRTHWPLLMSKGGSDTANRFFDWISPLDFIVKQEEVFAVHEPGTGQWLLDSSAFRKWIDGAIQVLWCYGIPGLAMQASSNLLLISWAKSWLRENSNEVRTATSTLKSIRELMLSCPSAPSSSITFNGDSKEMRMSVLLLSIANTNRGSGRHPPTLCRQSGDSCASRDPLSRRPYKADTTATFGNRSPYRSVTLSPSLWKLPRVTQESSL